jgi:GMP synthase (glutamine-hydrolysing)
LPSDQSRALNQPESICGGARVRGAAPHLVPCLVVLLPIAKAMDGALRNHELVVVLDFGSQYTHLIARRLRECKVFSELLAYDVSMEELKKMNPKGIILSGGPSSVYEAGAPHLSPGVLELGVPILGICYGLQEMSHILHDGSVGPGLKKEYGHAALTRQSDTAALLADVPESCSVWMSHGDKLDTLPKGFQAIAATDNCEFAAVADGSRHLYGLQFHPEVTHTECGTTILRNFVKGICGCKCDWTMKSFLEDAKAVIRETVGDGIVIGAVSGGVDSTVASILLKDAIGDQFHAFLVDNGVLRKNEANDVMERLRSRCGVNIELIDASQSFLGKLAGVTDPEVKRKIIGNTFIQVFEQEAARLDSSFLLQGTLYPDVIESVSHKGPSSTIKTHHNVGGLPKDMKLQLIEPLRFLFKDEVRQLGLELGLDRESVFRHPFPGPGLAIRILGELTTDRLTALREADEIFIEELRAAHLYEEIGQAFAVLLPVRTVGVMGDKRTYEEVIGLRAVKTTDYMTADWFDLPSSVLRRVSSRIVNEVPGVNRVLYDVTSKPPGTIEMT